VVCHCLAIEAGDGLVLVDTGFGLEDARNPGQLGGAFRLLMNPQPREETTALKQLEALGFAASDVRHIVTTHLDLDHSGGLPDFPGAEVHLLSAELEAALHPALTTASATSAEPTGRTTRSGSPTTPAATTGSASRASASSPASTPRSCWCR